MADVKLLPSSIFLPIPLTSQEVEIHLEYEGIPRQRGHCLELENDARNCPKKKKKKKKSNPQASEPPTGIQAVSSKNSSTPQVEATHSAPPPTETQVSTPLSTPEVEKEVAAIMEALLENNSELEQTMDTDAEGWLVMGKKGKATKQATPLPLPSPSKKRQIASSILEQQVWDTLNFRSTPPDGEKRLQIWPVIYTVSQSKQRRYLSLLQGELQCTRVSLQ